MIVEARPREQVVDLLRAAQARIVAAFEALEPTTRFESHTWERPGRGGGTAQVLAGGETFAKVAVNVSAVSGEEVPVSLARQHEGTAGQAYFATGLSLIAHAVNPYVPSFHANYRYFEVADGRTWWFGGGADLTPVYGFEADAVHFHSVLKGLCDTHDSALYPQLKSRCDEYFQIPHRGEARGVGGIFFDQLGRPAPRSAAEDRVGERRWQQEYEFVDKGLQSIANAYLPIVESRRWHEYGERQLDWQAHRRGRYVEFNLLHDRGTLFGLQTDGNIEAILASLPPLAAWSFGHAAEPGSEEAALAAFLQPRDWLGSTNERTAAGFTDHTSVVLNNKE